MLSKISLVFGKKIKSLRITFYDLFRKKNKEEKNKKDKKQIKIASSVFFMTT